MSPGPQPLIWEIFYLVETNHKTIHDFFEHYMCYTHLNFSHVSSPNLSMTSDFRHVLIKPYCEKNNVSWKVLKYIAVLKSKHLHFTFKCLMIFFQRNTKIYYM